MIVHALFFAAYRDVAGSDTIEVELPENATGRDLVALLRQRGPAWQRLPSEPVITVNADYAPLSTTLRPGDEVAFIPPVSGG